jgi:nitronate monooxygenase
MALVPQIADAVRIPVLAAGGTADGQGITVAFALEASGVQLGTAFLGCPEPAVPPLYPAQLNTVSDDAPEVTPAFTGRPARAIRNRFVAEISGAEALKFPLQASIVCKRASSARSGQVPDEHVRAQLMPFWAGQAAALIREPPAGELVDKLAAETRSVLGRST